MVAVAQLVEHRIVDPVVAGSIPVGHPTKALAALIVVSLLLLVRPREARA
jgi:hypothetical protein